VEPPAQPDPAGEDLAGEDPVPAAGATREDPSGEDVAAEDPEGVEAEGADAPMPRPKRGYLLPGAIALAVLVIIGVVVGAGDIQHSAPTSLYGKDVASNLSGGIETEQGWHTAPQLMCPPVEPARQGLEFQCTLVHDGNRQTVDVYEVNNHGNLRWSLAG
jgi:hypothetical protein